MAQIDELITRYTLDDRYSAKAQKVAASTEAVSAKLGKAQGMFKGTFSQAITGAGSKIATLGSGIAAIAGPVGIAVGAVTALGGAFAAMGVMAAKAIGGMTAELLNAYAPIDANARKWQVFLEDGATGAQQMEKFIRRYMQSSNFTYTGLAGATTKLLMMGADVEAMLPVLERLATAEGSFTDSSLIETADIFQRLKGGARLAELRESLGRYGISTADVRSIGGLKPEDEADSAKVMEAIVATINQKLAGVVETAGGSVFAVMGNLKDSFSSLFATIGATIAPHVLPIVEKLASWFTWLGEEVLPDVSAALGSIVGDVFGDSKFDFMETLLGMATNFIRNVPTIVGFVVNTAKTFWPVIKGLLNMAITASEIITNRFIGFLMAAAKIAGIFINTKKFQNDLTDFQSNLREGNNKWRGMLDGKNPFGDEDPLAGFKGWQDSQGAAIGAPKAKQNGDDEDASADSLVQRNSDNLAKIESNTRETKESLSRFIVGGGDKGKLGMTPVEMHKLKTVKVDFGSGKLETAMGEMFNQMLMELIRQGVLVPN